MNITKGYEKTESETVQYLRRSIERKEMQIAELYSELCEAEHTIEQAIKYIKEYNMLISGCWDASPIPEKLLKILKKERK